jgi:acyl carrier protein
MEERFKSEKHFCQLRTVSEIIRENNIERIDLLKIDVERSEYDVLCGIEYDDWEKIRQIVIEVDTRENLDRITALLESRDYQVVVEDYVNVEAEDENSEVDVFMLYARQKSAEWRQPVARSVGKLAPEKTSISIDGLRGFLKQSLPEYMIPSSFMFLDELPLTPNGKVDRKSLPEPETLRPELETPYLAPQTAAERTIAAIWQEALGIERVGIHDNFFEVGGTSILLVQVNSRLRESFKTNIPMVEMFRHSSISSMVKYLTRKQNDHTSLQQIHNRAIKQTDTTNLKNQFRKARQRKKTADSQ